MIAKLVTENQHSGLGLDLDDYNINYGKPFSATYMGIEGLFARHGDGFTVLGGSDLDIGAQLRGRDGPFHSVRYVAEMEIHVKLEEPKS